MKKKTPIRMNKNYRLKPAEQPAKASDPEICVICGICGRHSLT